MDRGWKQTSSSVLSDKAQSNGSGAFLERGILVTVKVATRYRPLLTKSRYSGFTRDREQPSLHWHREALQAIDFSRITSTYPAYVLHLLCVI